MDVRPEVLDAYQAAVDEANAAMAWGVEGVDNGTSSPPAGVTELAAGDDRYWDLTRRRTPPTTRSAGGQ